MFNKYLKFTNLLNTKLSLFEVKMKVKDVTRRCNKESQL